MQQDVDSVRNLMQGLRDRMNMIEESNNVFKNQATEIKREINTFFDELVKFKRKFTEDLIRFQKGMHHDFNEVKNQVTTSQTKLDSALNQVSNHYEELKRIDFLIGGFRKNIEELYGKVVHVRDAKADRDHVKSEIAKDRKEIENGKQENAPASSNYHCCSALFDRGSGDYGARD